MAADHIDTVMDADDAIEESRRRNAETDPDLLKAMRELDEEEEQERLRMLKMEGWPDEVIGAKRACNPSKLWEYDVVSVKRFKGNWEENPAITRRLGPMFARHAALLIACDAGIKDREAKHKLR